MKPSVNRLFFVTLCMIALSITGSAFAETNTSELIPAGVVIKEDYSPGVGASVGEISQVSGKVAVVHAKDTEGYWASEGNKLFKGDTMITLTDGFAAFKLEDGSFMTLSPETKLEITKSVYAPEKESRSIFINMVVGKTRFVVKKLVKARHSEFKVKTTTSVAGVRGSDFIIAATDDLTEVTALQDTELEVISLAAPDVKPMILRDFERTTVRKGALPEEARKVSAEEVDRMMREFRYRPSDTAPEGGMDQMQDQERTGQKPPPDKIYGMMLRDKDLVRPDFRLPPAVLKQLSYEDRFRIIKRIRDEKKIESQRDSINQLQTEAIIKTRLPDFPGTP